MILPHFICVPCFHTAVASVWQITQVVQVYIRMYTVQAVPFGPHKQTHYLLLTCYIEARRYYNNFISIIRRRSLCMCDEEIDEGNAKKNSLLD